MKKPMGVYLSRQEKRYMEEQKEIEELNQTQPLQRMINNIKFSYDREKHTRNNGERNSTSYNIKKNTVITRKPTLMDQSAQEGK